MKLHEAMEIYQAAIKVCSFDWSYNDPDAVASIDALRELIGSHRQMISSSEASVEAELKTKGLNAPRLTSEHIDAQVRNVQYCVFVGTTMTVCAITLRNGFVVIGNSAAASKENFDEAIGRRIAYDNARNKIWALEGYLLRETLHHIEYDPHPFEDYIPVGKMKRFGDFSES
jgi:hypothetical protein